MNPSIGVPDEMLLNGRGADQDFSESEMLFYRLKMPCGNAGDRPSGLDMEYPDFSVNREKHGGIPEFVLLPKWLTCGIGEFRKGDIPGPDTSDGGIEYSWPIIHVPEDMNYYHSEIQTFKSGVHCHRSSQVNKIVFRRFRQRLAEAMTITRQFDSRRTTLA